MRVSYEAIEGGTKAIEVDLRWPFGGVRGSEVVLRLDQGGV